MLDVAAIAVFLFSILVVIYVYAGYPLILFALTGGRFRKAPAQLPEEKLPSVTMLIAACNEAAVIREKLENCLKLDYPAAKLRFAIAADGCTDGTVGIIEEFQERDPRIRTFIRPHRLGKINALAAVLPQCDTDLILFSDANTFYDPQSIRLLARHFQDPKVGVVTGDVRLRSAGATFSEGESLYYRYERWLQKVETSFWATVAIDGAMYAVRRELIVLPEYREVPDDLVISLTAGSQGYRMIYDPEALATETATPTNEEEFRRKVRIAAHGIQAWMHNAGVPPMSQFRLWWAYTSHKLLRWLVPVFLVAMLASNIVLAVNGTTIGPALLVAHIAFYVLALMAYRHPGLESFLFRVPYYFSMVNLAMLLGVYRGFTKKEAVLGFKTSRIPVSGD